MKKTGLCPKRCTQYILHVHNKGLWKRNSYHRITIGCHIVDVDKYICQDCGYIGYYVGENDLKKCKESD